jgi:hypothetical protein
MRENCEGKKEEKDKMTNNFRFAKTEDFTSATVKIVFWYVWRTLLNMKMEAENSTESLLLSIKLHGVRNQ